MTHDITQGALPNRTPMQDQELGGWADKFAATLRRSGGELSEDQRPMDARLQQLGRVRRLCALSRIP